MEAMEAVLVAAETGSFSLAAERLDVTHGAISRRVAAVEHWSGRALFQRHGRGVRLTLAGQRTVARIEQALATLEDGGAFWDDEPELPVVRVGMVRSFARLWFIPHLAALEGKPADLRLEPEIDDRHMTLSDARIAIRLGRGDWAGVTAEPLFSETLQPVANAELAVSLGPDPAAADILRHPLLHDAQEEGWRLWLSAQGHDYERRRQDRILGGHDLVLQAAGAGLGIALARLPYADPSIEREGLMMIGNAQVTNPNRFHVVTKTGTRSDVVERLVRRIKALASGG